MENFITSLFCLTNISAPLYLTELVLYSKYAYGSQFSGEKKRLKNPILGFQDIKQTPSLILFRTPCMIYDELHMKHDIQYFLCDILFTIHKI